MSGRLEVCEDVLFIIAFYYERQTGKESPQEVMFVCVQKKEQRKNTQIRDARRHALAADVIPQAFIVVFFRHQILQPLKCGLVLPT